MTAQFRWMAGTQSKATIQGTASAALTGWTYFGRRWAVDVAPVIDRFVEEVTGLDNSIAELGKINFTVSFITPNAAMIDYLQDTFFAGGVRTAPQTLQVYDLPNYADQWITVNCTGRLPARKAAVLGPRNGRIPYYTVEFVNGTIASAS
jgi:hypothetical protein